MCKTNPTRPNLEDENETKGDGYLEKSEEMSNTDRDRKIGQRRMLPIEQDKR